jgi:hypothetical protein
MSRYLESSTQNFEKAGKSDCNVASLQISTVAEPFISYRIVKLFARIDDAPSHMQLKLTSITIKSGIACCLMLLGVPAFFNLCTV